MRREIATHLVSVVRLTSQSRSRGAARSSTIAIISISVLPLFRSRLSIRAVSICGDAIYTCKRSRASSFFAPAHVKVLSSPIFIIISQVTNNRADQTSAKFISRVDHLVYATTDLNRGIEEIEKLLGVRAIAGGQHPGRGTRNALVALGPTTYLEIIAPDPEQPPPKEPRPFGLDGVKESRLVAWFVNRGDLERLRAEAVRNGVPFGEVKSGSRRRADGVELSWQFTDPSVLVADGIIPFFINWGDSPHPARTSTKGAALVSLRAEYPDVQVILGMLRHLKIDLPVKQGPSPALIAVIESPRGPVELR